MALWEVPLSIFGPMGQRKFCLGEGREGRPSKPERKSKQGPSWAEWFILFSLLHNVIVMFSPYIYWYDLVITIRISSHHNFFKKSKKKKKKSF